MDVGALARALRSGHLAGAAADVFPAEPDGDTDDFASELRGMPNVILTPHVAGSTKEAQDAIGREVASALVKFINTGATTGSVNFPHVELPPLRDRHRLLNVHRNVPGVLSSINRIVADAQANIESQVLATTPDHRISRHGPQPGGVQGGPAADVRPGAEHPHARPVLTRRHSCPVRGYNPVGRTSRRREP